MTPVAPLSERLDGISWAFFFIWIGAALLADLSWGWTLFGVGALILATQAAQFLKTGKAHGFWIICGAAVLASSAWTVLGLEWPLAPVLLVLLGVTMLVSTLLGARRRP